MYEEKDYDFAIEVTSSLKKYVENIGKLLEKPSNELLESIDLIGCALTEAKERLFKNEKG